MSEVAEWKKEIDRVQNLLDISETPELLMSQSNGKIVLSDDNTTNIRNMLNYMNKNNNQSDRLVALSNNIEKELRVINTGEKMISGINKISDMVKYNITKLFNLKSNSMQIKEKESEIENLKNYIARLEDKSQSMSNKIINNKEVPVDENYEKNKIRNTIKSLKVNIYIYIE